MRQRKRLLLACSLTFCTLVLNVPAFASGEDLTTSPQQERTEGTIKGRVTDVLGEPIIGATVRLKDLNVGTITDVDGYYSLAYKIRPTAILVSYIGYIGRNVNYTGQSVVNVTLEEDTKMLNEVVVTGYQTISKERATGAFAIVNNEALEKRINLDITQALTGSVAGLTTYGGDVVIRGRSTISNNIGTNPLLVIDGLPTERSIDDININDIENLTILKDAAATSIYGSRAANGVIVITTKSGMKGKTTINFTSDWKWTENPSLSDFYYASPATSVDLEQKFWARSAMGNGVNSISVDQYVLNQNKGLGTTGSYVSPLMALRIRLANGEITQADYDAATKRMGTYDFRQDYMDAAWRTPFRQNYTLSISNASDRQNTYASFSYTGNALQMQSNSSETFKAYLKNTQKITRWLSVDMGIDAQYGSMETADKFFSFETQMSTFASYNPIYAENGDKYYLPYAPSIVGATQWNPMSITASYSPQRISDMVALGNVFKPMNYNVLDEIGNNTFKDNTLNLRSFAKLNIQLYKDLKFTTSFDYELSDSRQEKFNSENSYFVRQLYNRMISRTGTNDANYIYVKNIPNGGYLEQITTSRNNYTFRNQLDYNTSISEKHQITALLGFEMRQVENPMGTNSRYFGYDPQLLSKISPSGLNPTLIVNTGVTSLLYGNNQRVADALVSSPALTYLLNRYVSFYAAGGYGYKDLYNISGSIRVDQTNLFGTDPKYRYRPLWSVGAGWNISNEGFMKDVDWLDMLTIRGSYGLTGNVDQTSTPYITITSNTTSIASLDPYQYSRLLSPPNPDLRWEETSSYALGFDFSIFKRMLSGKIEGYYKYSDDLLVSSTLPRSTGYTTSVVNNGAMSNKGVEITLSSPWLNKGGWKLTSTLIYAYNYNRVEKVNLQPKTASNLVVTPYSYYMEGMPYNALYAYHCEGIKPTRVVMPDGTENMVGIPSVLDKDGNPLYEITPDGKSMIYTSPSNLAPENAVYMGTLDPRWNGSFTQTVQFRNLELMAMFTYYGGHKLRKPSYDYFIFNPGNNGTLSSDVEHAWSPSNPNSNIPTPSIYFPTAINSVGSQISEYWRYADIHVVDGDMVRLKSLSLSYVLPAKYARTLKLQKAKLTAQANDLWFWCAAGNDIDPETYSALQAGSSTVKTSNAISRTLPTMASALLRLEITF